jgi:hypothetical protein
VTTSVWRMVPHLRRLVLTLLIGAAVAAVLHSRRARPAHTSPLSVAEWPPFEPQMSAAAPPVERPGWKGPVDGTCPEDYPIKANDNSHIYHVPGGRFYARTVAERCYATAEAAERDGYRRSKA